MTLWDDYRKMEDKLLAIEKWYQDNKEEAIPYQRRPTKWDRLGMILQGHIINRVQSSASTVRNTK